MSSAAMFYREIAPSAEFAPLVFSYWEFRVEDGDAAAAPFSHEVFPDGCLALFFYRNPRFDFAEIFVAGLSLESTRIEVLESDVYWAMRLQPGAARAFLQTDPAEIRTQPLRFLEPLARRAEELKARLAACETLEAATNVFEEIFNCAKNIEIDERVDAAVKLIEINQANVKVADLARAVGLSARQFERRFRRAAGLTPKQYVRARRIRHTAINVLEETDLNWASRAAEMGFADQAHLAHELSAMTQQSPTHFAERVKQIEHGNVIK